MSQNGQHRTGFAALLERALKATGQVPDSARVSPRLTLKPTAPVLDYERELREKLEGYERSIENQRPRSPDEIAAVNALTLSCHAVRATWNSAGADPYRLAYEAEGMAAAAKEVERLATKQYCDTGRLQSKHSPKERKDLDTAFNQVKHLLTTDSALTLTAACKLVEASHGLGYKKIFKECRRCGIEGAKKRGRPIKIK